MTTLITKEGSKPMPASAYAKYSADIHQRMAEENAWRAGRRQRRIMRSLAFFAVMSVFFLIVVYFVIETPE